MYSCCGWPMITMAAVLKSIASYVVTWCIMVSGTSLATRTRILATDRLWQLRPDVVSLKVRISQIKKRLEVHARNEAAPSGRTRISLKCCRRWMKNTRQNMIFIKTIWYVTDTAFPKGILIINYLQFVCHHFASLARHKMAQAFFCSLSARC